MSLTDKLRELAEWLDIRNSKPFFHPPTTVYYDFRMRIGPLLTEAERLEAQNARLRELVREAYMESWGELLPNEYREEYWEQSAAKAALDALDKEGSDA